MIEVKKVSNLQFSYAKILVFGESGSGKTYFASTYNPEKTLFVNIKAESGMMTLRALGVDMDVIEVGNYGDMKEVIEFIKKSGTKYELIFIDSLSQWQKNLEKEVPESANKYAKWDIIKSYTKEIVDGFKALPFHVIFTCEIKKDKDETTGEILYAPSLLGSSREEIPYWFDEVYYFTRFQAKLSDPIIYRALTAAAMKYPCKSRLAASGKIPVLIDNPSLKTLIEISGFRKIDKKVQNDEIKELAEEPGQISETNLNQLRTLLAQKDVNIAKFLSFYGVASLPAFPDNKVADALTKLRQCNDKPVAEKAPVVAAKITPTPLPITPSPIKPAAKTASPIRAAVKKVGK